ncbi:hypothetical protein SEMRO_1406_G269940.1 [Seminavis robusta]|uniref:Uncharacterized protein n=1 Tax=Seminavis robusta TaxID=568900 RepID=A0A9N8HS75_9STRA|nr:hypothetical protein SEMRO_1406_G269940.1 [Seminavis robusta]|eukprot:Sro1406_g269940.1 n/a (127) ;mRNA; r:24988-25478
MANAGAAFGLEDVPDLEQPSTTGITMTLRQIHELAAQEDYTKAARFKPSALAGIQPHPLHYLKWHKKAISFYMPIKVPHGMELRQSNQVRSVNEVVKEVKKAETQHRGRSPVEYRKVVLNSTAKGL